MGFILKMQNIEIENFLKSEFKENYFKNFPLSEYTSFRCGGKAKYLVYPNTIEKVIKIFEVLKELKEKFLILGNGTNILVSDNGFDGVVISTLKMKNYNVCENTLECECGIKISDLLKICVKNSLSGIEFLAGIPGTLGGGIKNNAGLKKEWISEKIAYVEYLNIENLNITKKEKEKIFFSYRKSEFGDNIFIWRAGLLLEKKNKEEIKKEIKKHVEERSKKQPLGYSAGSIFKNPYPYYAGELIEKCGLKGYSIGDCFVSEKHANFIINKGEAKAKDIYRLIKIIKEKVKEKFNIELELEIQLIGEFE